jgi:NADPH:quinone reductase-like Zn-dependent oxidoreductase
MQALIHLVALGRVQPVIHQRLPLSEAAAAHHLLERSDFFGKVVLYT